jgi:hypothetical protein
VALNDIVVYPAAATGAAPVAANSAWGEGPAQTLISAITHDYAINGIELQSENNVATGSQDTTIEVEILIYVDGVLKITFPYSMRVDTNVGVYLLDGHDRQWIAEPFVVSAGSTVTVTAKCSSTSFRNWRVKIRGRDLANVRTDTGEVYLTLTPSGVEFPAIEYTDSGTVTLALTPSGTDDYVPAPTEYLDSGTVTLALTPSGTDEHTTFDSGTVTLAFTPSFTETYERVDSGEIGLVFTPSGTESIAHTYTDSGEIYLALTVLPGRYRMFNFSTVTDDFDAFQIGGVIDPTKWDGDVWGGSGSSPNALRWDASGKAKTSGGSFLTSWVYDEVIGPDCENTIRIDTMPTADNAVWLELRVQDPRTGAHSCYHAEWYKRSGADEIRLIRVVAGSQSFMGSTVTEEMQAGSELALSVRGTSPVLVEVYFRHPGEVDWVLAKAEVDSASDRIVDAGYGALGVGSDAGTLVDNYKQHTITYLFDEAVFRDIPDTYSLVYEDEFDDGTVDWDEYEFSSGTASESGGLLTIEPTPDNYYYELDSPTPYDLRRCQVTAKLVSLDADTNIGIGFEQAIGVANGPFLTITEFSSVYSLDASGVEDSIILPGLPDSIRIRDLGTEWVCEYSMDGIDWIAVSVTDHPEDPSSLYVFLGSGITGFADPGASAVIESLTIERATEAIYLTLTPTLDEYIAPTEDSGEIYLTLTAGVTAGAVDYDTEVFTDSPSFYWTMDESFGIAVQDDANLFTDQEIWATIVHYTDVNNLKGIQFFLNYDSGTDNGYRVDILNDSTSGTHDIWVISQIDGGTPTTLNFGNPTNYEEGDIVGATTLNHTIYVWRHRAGVTTLLGSHSDTTYEEHTTDYNIISPSDFDFDDIQSRDLGYGGLLVNTPTLGEPPLTGDGTSIHFNDGQDEYVDLLQQVLDPSAYNAGMGLEIWFKLDPATSGLDQGIFGAWKSSDSGGPLIWLNHIDGTLMGVYALVGLANYLDSGIIPDPDEVYHVVMNYDVGVEEVSLWVNGELKDTKPRLIADGGLGGSNNWAIARYNDDTNLCFAGWVQRAAIYPAPLTEERILAHYDAGLGIGGAPGETAQFVDEATITLLLTPSGTDDYETSGEQYEDSGTIYLTLTPSGTEYQTREYADSDTIPILFTISGTEEAQFVDSDTTYLTLTASGSDTFQAAESTTVDLRFTPSGTDEYTGVSHYEDTGTITLLLTPDGTEYQTRTLTDAGDVTLALTPSGTDTQTFEFADSGTTTLTFTPSGTDEHVLPTLDAGTATLAFTVSGTELHTQQTVDDGEIYLVLTPSGVEGPSRVFELYSTAYMRWQSSTVEHRLITYGYLRFDTVARMA